MKKRYLTKSLFKIGAECPSKLYYAKKENEYPSKKDGNEFLEALAEGGIQVGALAQAYYPDGVEIAFSSHEIMLEQTSELLKRDKVTIFEAAFTFEGHFVLVDILHKDGNKVDLIEVKSKSADGLEDQFVSDKTGYLKSNWKPYVLDIAFQNWVVSKAHLDLEINPYLMVMDKSKMATVDGLNQKFEIEKIEDTHGKVRAKVKEKSVKNAELGEEIMVRIPMSDLCNKVYDGSYTDLASTHKPEIDGFESWIETLKDYYQRDEQYPIEIGAKCKNCEYRIGLNDLGANQKSGFVECWKSDLGWKEDQFNEPLLFDLFNFRKSQEHLDNNEFYLMDLDLSKDNPPLVNVLNPGEKTWSTKERQVLQIQAEKNGLVAEEFIHPSLKEELNSWQYPLHFIDFEGSRSVIPFVKDMGPYEQSLFQFSIHTAYEDGRIEHSHEWLHLEKGVNPNIDFARALKAAIGESNGSVLIWSQYENTGLNYIRKEFDSIQGNIVPDKSELIAFLDTLVYDENQNPNPSRKMIDLLDVEKKYYYNTLTKGSNSIKAVLPAILNTSDFLKNKYSKPSYNSTNYANKQWVVYNENGIVVDPYKLLGQSDEVLHFEANSEGGIANGGQAMIEWAKVQFMSTTQEEVDRIRKELLRYCELDTFAMVMIWEGWKVGVKIS
ncbi:MAG: DUF2779 domain-containing protein [Bacteroidetes bacterium]|nr:DUF2779 domain-containing protein [Bacteroidota bacterium]